MEEWRDIPGWEGLYQVSSQGRVRSLSRLKKVRTADGAARYKPISGRIIRQNKLYNGYLRVEMNDAPRVEREMVHRLVCLAFHGPPPPGAQAAHGDGKKDNNTSDNLRWATAAENQADRKVHGTYLSGEEAPGSKLTECEVLDIRRRRARGEKQKALGQRYGVTRQAIRQIVQRLTWKHI